MVTVYTVASAKGGVGKTTTAAAIATLLADAGASVVAIDADLGMANLAGALGINVEGETVHDVLAGRAEPEAAVQEGPRGLRVLPGETDLDAYADADPAGLADVVATFADADYVILDAGAGLSHDSALPLGIADRTLLVSTPEREALRDTAKTGELADRLGGTVDGAVACFLRPDRIDVDPDDVIATAGGSEALHIALEAHVDAGDEVIIPDPGFVSYDALTRLTGGTPVPVPLREDLTIDPDAIEAAITDDTAAFVVNSPGNPTGAVSPPEDVREFARIADEHDVLCISDEVYEHIVFEGEHRSPAEFAETDSVVVVNACSKAYSMTGWRLGWVAASEERASRMVRVHQYIQACASAPAQYAAEAALTGPQDSVTEMVSAFEERRNVLLDGLEEMGLDVPTPKGAFYAMPKVPEGWCDEVIDRGVVVVPGDAFGAGGEGYARISYAASLEEVKEAIEVMDEATRALR